MILLEIYLVKKEQNAHLQFLSQLPGCSLHRNKKLDIKNMNKKLEVALKKVRFTGKVGASVTLTNRCSDRIY